MEQRIERFVEMVKECYNAEEVHYDCEKHQWLYLRRGKVKVVGATMLMCYMLFKKMATVEEIDIIKQMFT